LFQNISHADAEQDQPTVYSSGFISACNKIPIFGFEKVFPVQEKPHPYNIMNRIRRFFLLGIIDFM
jgi:hypothetical protein